MKYLISGCLANQAVRYDGKAYYYEKIQELIQQKQAITACPEMLGGLSTPREPAEIVGGLAEDVFNGSAKIMTILDEDVTSAFIEGAYKTLKIAQLHQVEIVVLKENSPSCSRHFVYDGHFSGQKNSGQGLTAYLLIKHGFHVISEQEFLENLSEL